MLLLRAAAGHLSSALRIFALNYYKRVRPTAMNGALWEQHARYLDMRQTNRTKCH